MLQRFAGRLGILRRWLLTKKGSGISRSDVQVSAATQGRQDRSRGGGPVKYYLFTGETHYPNGGAGDFAGVFATLAEATAHPISQWAHVADENMKQVAFWHYHGRWQDGAWINE